METFTLRRWPRCSVAARMDSFAPAPPATRRRTKSIDLSRVFALWHLASHPDRAERVEGSAPRYFFLDTSVFSSAGRNSSYFEPGLHSTQPSYPQSYVAFFCALI